MTTSSPMRKTFSLRLHLFRGGAIRPVQGLGYFMVALVSLIPCMVKIEVRSSGGALLGRAPAASSQSRPFTRAPRCPLSTSSRCCVLLYRVGGLRLQRKKEKKKRSTPDTLLFFPKKKKNSSTHPWCGTVLSDIGGPAEAVGASPSHGRLGGLRAHAARPRRFASGTRSPSSPVDATSRAMLRRAPPCTRLPRQRR